MKSTMTIHTIKKELFRFIERSFYKRFLGFSQADDGERLYTGEPVNISGLNKVS